jgi:PKD repeat protein
LRHLGDSLDQYPANRDRFWSLLQNEGVLAYFCGHTHNYSAVNVDGVWQVDAGHARGAGDTGAPSTFVVVHVDGGTVTFDAYRDEHDGTYDYDDITHHTHAITDPSSVQASFTASPTWGVEPLTVGFTNISNGDYVDSLWAFGDGVTSTLQSPTHTYTALAVYTVALTVSGPEGSDTGTKARYITVRGRHSVYLPLVVRRPEVFRARHLAPKIATIRSESG